MKTKKLQKGIKSVFYKTSIIILCFIGNGEIVEVFQYRLMSEVVAYLGEVKLSLSNADGMPINCISAIRAVFYGKFNTRIFLQ